MSEEIISFIDFTVMSDEEKYKLLNIRDNRISSLNIVNEELGFQLQQKENIIKELNDRIEDDKMIIEGNWGCIDNLKKDYILQKNIIKEVREYIKNKSMIVQLDNTMEFAIDLYLKEPEYKELLEILDKENK